MPKILMQFLVLIAISLVISACNRSPISDLKSPCVGAEILDGNSHKNPCVRRMVNDNWLA